MTRAQAPGKAILFGEHAVVYGQPAIAVPIRQIQATAEVGDIRGAAPGQIWIEAPDVHFAAWLHDCDSEHPLARILLLTLVEIEARDFPALHLRVTSSIPVAAGLGSGAAVSVAIVRAVCEHLGQPLPLDRQSTLAFAVEKLHHGTPSGIDNTVITYDRPVYFVREHSPTLIAPPSPLTLVVGDTGRPSPTAHSVAKVREAWRADQERYESLFQAIGQTVREARDALQEGRVHDLGPLMNHNQALLEALGVSCDELEALIEAARGAGALGAKLCGGGLGGNMIALVEPGTASAVEKALAEAGARRTIRTEVST